MVVGEVTRVIQARCDVFARQIRKLIDDLIESIPRREITKNQRHGDASAVNTRLPAQYIRCTDNMLAPWRHIRVCIHLRLSTSPQILRG